MYCPNCGFYNKINMGVCLNCKLPLEKINSDETISLLDSDIELKMDSIEENIYSYDNKFLIVADIKGVKINYGFCNTIQEAVQRTSFRHAQAYPLFHPLALVREPALPPGGVLDFRCGHRRRGEPARAGDAAAALVQSQTMRAGRRRASDAAHHPFQGKEHRLSRRRRLRSRHIGIKPRPRQRAVRGDRARLPLQERDRVADQVLAKEVLSQHAHLPRRRAQDRGRAGAARQPHRRLPALRRQRTLGGRAWITVRKERKTIMM